jgi:hypothetical protein
VYTNLDPAGLQRLEDALGEVAPGTPPSDTPPMDAPPADSLPDAPHT